MIDKDYWYMIGVGKRLMEIEEPFKKNRLFRLMKIHNKSIEIFKSQTRSK